MCCVFNKGHLKLGEWPCIFEDKCDMLILLLFYMIKTFSHILHAWLLPVTLLRVCSDTPGLYTGHEKILYGSGFGLLCSILYGHSQSHYWECMISQPEVHFWIFLAKAPVRYLVLKNLHITIQAVRLEGKKLIFLWKVKSHDYRTFSRLKYPNTVFDFSTFYLPRQRSR